MGAKNFNRNVKYYSLKDGQIVNKDKDKNVTVYDCLFGRLIQLKLRDEEYKDEKYKSLSITLYDGEETSILQMKFNSGYARAFMKMLPNIDVSKELELSAKSETTENSTKKKTTTFLRQDNKPVKWHWTKNDDRTDLPAPEEILDKKKNVIGLDYSKQELFLLNMVEVFNTTLQGLEVRIIEHVESNGNAQPEKTTQQNTSEFIADDLPF